MGSSIIPVNAISNINAIFSDLHVQSFTLPSQNTVTLTRKNSDHFSAGLIFCGGDSGTRYGLWYFYMYGTGSHQLVDISGRPSSDPLTVTTGNNPNRIIITNNISENINFRVLSVFQQVGISIAAPSA